MFSIGFKMDKMRRPWRFVRRDTDSVPLETVDSITGTAPVDQGKGAQAQSKSADSDTHSDEAKAIEEDLRRFSVLHEFDPNLPCRYHPSHVVFTRD